MLDIFGKKKRRKIEKEKEVLLGVILNNMESCLFTLKKKKGITEETAGELSLLILKTLESFIREKEVIWEEKDIEATVWQALNALEVAEIEEECDKVQEASQRSDLKERAQKIAEYVKKRSDGKTKGKGVFL